MVGLRKLRGIAAGAATLGFLAVSPVAAAPASASPLTLAVSQSTAFSILGYDCGGIRQYDYATGFDPASSYPDVDAYLWTTCSAGGRGGHSFTVSAWLSTSWDFTGAMISDSVLAAAPSVDPALSVVDGHGNTLYNQSNAAYLQLAAGFVPAPRLVRIAPSTAPQGSPVTITGTGFTGATSVRFGATPAASFTVNSDTSITAAAPAVKTGTVNVEVTGPGGTSAVTPADAFTFDLAPRIATISPSHGSADGGTVVTISGVNFVGVTGVTFGGLPAHFKVVNSTTIKATSPGYPDPAAVDVVVTNKYGYNTITPTDAFTYT